MTETETDDTRRLPATATFADLVDAARATDSANDSHSDAGCLLRGSPQPHRLEADLLPAARPLPPAQSQLATLVEEQVGSPTILSAWGNVAGELPDLVLLAFTATSLNAVKLPAVAVFATHTGVFVRGADPLIREQPDAMDSDAAAALLTRVAEPSAVYVTADADFPLARLLALMRLLPNRHELAFALALPKATRLPGTAAANRDGLCPDGLPAPERSQREGELSVAAAQTAVAPLREAALSCALSTGGRALLGGRLVLGVRIGADGKAQHACFVADAIGEPLLRRCLISAARDLTFPTPSPAGFADLQMPIQLELEGPAAQRVSCD